MTELKAFTKFIIEFGEAIDKARADGHLGVEDLPLLIGPLMQVGPAFEDFDKVKEQMKELTDPEKMKEIVAYVKEELDLSNDKVEFTIERGLDLGAQLYEFITLFKKSE